MNSERITLLKKYIEENPEEPFNYYAIALEFLHENPQESVRLFDHLLEFHPNYLATYYQAATLQVELNNEPRALEIFKRGIDLATEKQDQLTLRELRNAYNNLLFEDD